MEVSNKGFWNEPNYFLWENCDVFSIFSIKLIMTCYKEVHFQNL